MRGLNFAAGETIVEQNADGDSLFIIVEGVVGVSVQVAGDEIIEVDRMGAGTFFGEMALLTDLSCTGGEAAATFTWESRPCVDHRNANRFHDPPNPPAVASTVNGVHLCAQARHAGGEYATAWKESPLGDGRRVILSIADTFPDRTAGAEAVATVEKVSAADFDALLDRVMRIGRIPAPAQGAS